MLNFNSATYLNLCTTK